MRFSGALVNKCLLVLIYVCFLLRYIASAVPLEIISTSSSWKNSDILSSSISCFYESEYYHLQYNAFASSSNEEQDLWVVLLLMLVIHGPIRFSPMVHTVIFQLAAQSDLSLYKREPYLSPLGGDTASAVPGDKMYILFKLINFDIDTNLDDSTNVNQRMVTINPLNCTDIVGGFQGYRQQFKGHFVHCFWKRIGLKRALEYMKFVFEIQDSTVDEIITYN
jgi:hypothetical protein